MPCLTRDPAATSIIVSMVQEGGMPRILAISGRSVAFVDNMCATEEREKNSNAVILCGGHN